MMVVEGTKDGFIDTYKGIVETVKDQIGTIKEQFKPQKHTEKRFGSNGVWKIMVWFCKSGDK